MEGQPGFRAILNLVQSMSSESPAVVIIGAGIVGSSIAYHLSARGCTRVTVLEQQDREAAGSTARSAAGVRHQFATEVNVRLSLYSIERLRHFSAEIGADAGFRQTGYLLLVYTPDQWRQYQASIALQNSLGVRSRAVSVTEAESMLPPMDADGLVGATYCPDDGYCDPHSVAMGYLNAARRLGVTVRRATPATAIRTSGGKVSAVATPSGDIDCDVVVNAAGPWAGEVGAMAGLRVPVQPVRRCIYMTEELPALRTFPFTIDTESGFYMRREGNRVLFGASNEAETPGFKHAVDWVWMEEVLGMGARRFPFLAEAGVVRRNCWAGHYEVTPDHNPVLGRHPELSNYIDASGFSGHGVMHSPATGMLMAEEILDGRAHSINIDALRITRFLAPSASSTPAQEQNVY